MISSRARRAAAAMALVVLALLAVALPACAEDWPMWRYDANRSAASPQELPAKLHLQWRRTYPPQRAAWPDQPLMPFDTGYEPVVLGHTLFLGSSRIDSVTAIDTRTGSELWRFHAEGPVRFAPVAWEGKVYFVSDDGYLYCVDAEKGSLVWKFRGGPSDRKILGKIKRREEAKKIYEEARNAGRLASLLDQERPNIFTQSVGNIEPGKEVKIQISYVDVLRYDLGTYEFQFPMVVGPRYIPGASIESPEPRSAELQGKVSPLIANTNQIGRAHV